MTNTIIVLSRQYLTAKEKDRIHNRFIKFLNSENIRPGLYMTKLERLDKLLNTVLDNVKPFKNA